MTVAAVLAELAEAGATVAIVEGKVKLRAPRPLPPQLVEAARAHKAEIVEHLTRPATTSEWGPADWAGYRLRQRTVLAGLRDRPAVDLATYQNCVSEWLSRHPADDCGPERCRHCGAAIAADGSGALPILVPAHPARHVWLHEGCLESWTARRLAEAAESLATVGIAPPAARSSPTSTLAPPASTPSSSASALDFNAAARQRPPWRHR